MAALINGTVPVFEPGGDDARLSLLNRATPLAPPPTAADAADWHRQNLADTWDAAKDPQTWQDAADQYRSALLMGSIAPTESPAFQAWFGKSVLKDAEGKPMVLYHGTNADIEKFLPMQKTGPTGPFLSADPAVASRYTRMQNLSTTSATNANVMPVYVRMENPLVHDHGGEPWNYRTERDLLRAAKAGGYDGIIWQNVHDMGGPQTQYIPLDPRQIKSAIGNRGTYDPRDPRLTYGLAGLTLGSGAAAAASGGGQDQQQ